MANCEVLGTLLRVHVLHVHNYTCAPLCKLSLDTILKGETGLWSNCLMTNDKNNNAQTHGNDANLLAHKVP